MFGGVRRRNGRGQVYPWFSLFFLSYFFKRKKEERAKYLSDLPFPHIFLDAKNMWKGVMVGQVLVFTFPILFFCGENWK